MIGKYYPIFIAVIKRTFRSLHLVMSAVLGYLVLTGGVASLASFTEDDRIIERLSAVVDPAAVLVVFSVVLVCFSLYDEDSKHRYLVYMKENNTEADFKSNIGFFKSFKFRYTDYVALTLFLLMFGSTIDNFAKGIMSPNAFASFGFLIRIGVIALFLAVYFFSSAAGASLWANELYSHDYESYNPNKILSIKGVITVFIYILDIVLIFAVLPAFIGCMGLFVVLMVDYKELFLSIFAVFYAFFYLRARIRRRRFIHDLKSICKSNGIEVKVRPAARFIYASGRRALTLKGKNGEYDIYFISSLFKSNTIRVYDGFKFNKVFKLEVRRRNKFLMYIPVTFKKKVRFKGERTEILVANPVTKSIQVKEKGIKGARELHEADKIWGVGIYSGEGFRNAFDRMSRDMQKL